MPKKQRSVLYYFIIIFLPAIFVSFILLATVFYIRYTSAKESLITDRMIKLELMHNEIEFTLGNVISDLDILSKMDPFKELIDSESEQSLLEVEQIFKIFCTERGIYDQVRFIDKSGMEIIRVNYNRGEPFIVSQENLQFKGNRYYFQDVFILDKGEVFFSPLDLNVEGGVVENPQKPMVRVGIPVFDHEGNKKGVLLLNYFGQNIIDIVSGYAKLSEDRFSLLNADSYWLYSRNPEQNWSFMYEDKLKQNFVNSNSDIWNKMLSMDSGIIKNMNNTYIFITVSPMPDHLHVTTVKSSLESNNLNWYPENYFWKIVADIPDSVFYKLAFKIVSGMVIFILSVIIVSAILSVMLAKLWYIQKLSEQHTQKSLEEKELLLREIHHRVKNSLALVSSFVGLYQGEHPEQSKNDFFDELQQKINTISLVHTYLYQSSDIEHISFKSYIKVLLENMLDNFVISTGNIGLDLDVEDVFLPAKSTISIGLIISELTINSLKYAFPNNETGKITVKFTQEGSDYVLIYSDDGIGLPDSFNIKNSDSLGMILIESLTEQLGGTLNIITGSNSTFTIKFSISK